MQGYKVRSQIIDDLLTPAFSTIDLIIRQAIESSNTLEELDISFKKVREVLQIKSLFFEKVEDAVHGHFPHKVDEILNRPYAQTLRKGLCPAFPIMDKVCDAFFPH